MARSPNPRTAGRLQPDRRPRPRRSHAHRPRLPLGALRQHRGAAAGRHGRRARTLRRPGCRYGSSRTLISRGPTPSLPL
ncbi:hypothetical protein VM57_01785 [Stenotrophomonas maltophilia]|uniref:Uncharacterized protein n=1 Tax=Stenotrophomonas maltophilia TaxID=40324 RepID=A0A0F5ZPT0_STEMA|nr:hypothetical protein VM57_01785 [Stenotrophomonas maltophilia]